MNGLEKYDTIKKVKNTCPSCKSVGLYRLRFKYEDEGRMVCQNCTDAQAQTEHENDIERDIQSAKDELNEYLNDTNLVHAIENLITALIKRED